MRTDRSCAAGVASRPHALDAAWAIGKPMRAFIPNPVAGDLLSQGVAQQQVGQAERGVLEFNGTKGRVA